MSSDINRWQGTMNLGGDSELRFTQAGQAVLNFRGACTERYRDANKQDKEITTWVNCVLWGNRGEALAPHLLKGTRLYIEGSLRIGSYDDKEGNKRVDVKINVTELQFMGGKRAGAADGEPSEISDDGEGGHQQHAGGGGYGGAQHPPQSSTGYQPRGGSGPSAGDFEIAFGRDKGQRISQVADLSWLRGALERDLADSSKERFHEKARGQIAAIDAELARRTSGGARAAAGAVGGGGGYAPRGQQVQPGGGGGLAPPEGHGNDDYDTGGVFGDDEDIPFLTSAMGRFPRCP